MQEPTRKIAGVLSGEPDNPKSPDDLLSPRDIAMFASAVLLAMAGTFGIARAGIHTDLAALSVVCGIGLLFVNVPALSGRRWFSCGPALWIYPASLLAASGFLPETPAAVAGVCGAVAGWVLLLWNTVRWRKSRSRALAVIAGLWVGLFCAGVYWGSGYASPLYEYTVLTGEAHGDTLFHASLANMIRTHGVPSTGLDGFPFVHYHFASHWLVARLAQVAGISVWAFYNYAFGLIFIPVLVSNLLQFARCVSDGHGPKFPHSLFWITTLAGLIGVLPSALSEAIGLDPTLPWISESYVLGIALSFTILGMALAFYRELPDNRRAKGQAHPIALLVVFPAVLVICGFAKVSILFLLIGMAWYACFRLDLWRQPVFSASLLFSTVLAWGVSQFGLDRRAHIATLSDHLRIARDFQWRYPYYAIFHFFWLWVFLLMCLGLGIFSWKKLMESWRGRRNLAAELLVVCCVAGVLPGVVLDLSSDSEYFSHYQAMLGLALVLGSLHLAGRWQRTAAYACLVLLGWNCALSTLNYGKKLLSTDMRIRVAVEGGSTKSVGNPARLVQLLADLDKRSLREKRETAIYIPKSNRVFWTLGQVAFATPFVPPALTGIAMIGGLPDNIAQDYWEEYHIGHGYRFYSRPASGVPAARALDEALHRAFSLGFQRVVIIDQLPDGGCCMVSERNRSQWRNN